MVRRQIVVLTHRRRGGLVCQRRRTASRRARSVRGRSFPGRCSLFGGSSGIHHRSSAARSTGRHRQDMAGHRVPNRYKLSNRYIIGSLEISGAEQHHMKTIIGEEERQRRRLARRRAQGIVERPIYLANAAEKRTRAVELRDATGMTHSEIAEEARTSRCRMPHVSGPYEGQREFDRLQARVHPGRRVLLRRPRAQVPLALAHL